ncbi:MAG: hypothetical protein Q9167_000938 [Letrouitia subvulpina]
MADGYARFTGKPQAVIVHVDVGTQALGQAIHNASCGRVPVLIFAGLSPFTIEGEMTGSRSEFIHWLQDVPDQKAIVSQYCRYSAEIKTGSNVKYMVNRALQFAMSDPKGPVYLVGAREVMEESVDPYIMDQSQWAPMQLGSLPDQAIHEISTALVYAEKPLVITGFAGRDQNSVGELVHLVDTVKGLRVKDAGTTEMSFPANHRAFVSAATEENKTLEEADVIVVIDCDVPWIPTQSKPRLDAKIFHIDVDPLKINMNVFYIPAMAKYRADSYTALAQINDYLAFSSNLQSQLSNSVYSERWNELAQSHRARRKVLAAKAELSEGFLDAPINISYLSARLRTLLPHDTIWVTEAVTNHVRMMEQIQPSLSGHWFTKGAGGLGWSGGASLGVKLAADAKFAKKNPSSEQSAFVCNITGDGSFVFSVPTAVYWVQDHYKLPTLTIVLNNGGWAAPRHSASYVNPKGAAQTATKEESGCGFGPNPPDYGIIAQGAAGGSMYRGKVDTVEELDECLMEAMDAVCVGIGAIVDVVLVEDSENGYFDEEVDF